MSHPTLSKLVLSCLVLAPLAPAQVRDQVVVFVNGDDQAVLRYDRRLDLLGASPVETGVLSTCLLYTSPSPRDS